MTTALRVLRTDVAVVGGGGAGLRAALAAAEAAPELEVTVISKVYPLRSHTVAAEGGAAGVAQAGDSAEEHAADTLLSGEGLGHPDVVARVVERAPMELAQLERWGCPWSRTATGDVALRPFGGMSRPRTWYAADRTGLHFLRTLLQTSLRHPAIRRLDEHLVLELLVRHGRAAGVLAHDQRTGEQVLVEAAAVVLATGGAGRVYARSTNSAIVTGDGIAMAFRAGVPLRDMELVQYHPTALPASGQLITEACRGEGGVLRDAGGRRYLADHGLGPETPPGEPRPRRMELGPRDRLCQAFWHERRAGRTVPTPDGDAVHLDLRHLGADVLRERLPLTWEQLGRLGIDPLSEPIPVAPAVHYLMGGVEAFDPEGGGAAVTTRLPGLYAAGECASSGLHGANRLGSNSLAEVLVLGRDAGERAARHATGPHPRGGSPRRPAADPALRRQAEEAAARQLSMLGRGEEDPVALHRELGRIMEEGAGIVRTAEAVRAALRELAELRERYARVRVTDTSLVHNTDWAEVIELGAMLDVAGAILSSALARQESRGAHQLLGRDPDPAAEATHTLAWHAGGEPRVERVPVSSSQPAQVAP